MISSIFLGRRIDSHVPGSHFMTPRCTFMELEVYKPNLEVYIFIVPERFGWPKRKERFRIPYRTILL